MAVNDDNLADPRWAKLNSGNWRCHSCGNLHNGLFDLGCARPDHWQDGEQVMPNSEALKSKHFLSKDFCVLNNEHFFVRGVLLLPILGTDSNFGFGVWSTLSQKNFEIYLKYFDNGSPPDLGPWFGWFSNQLKGYPDTLNLKCQVHPRPGRLRPSFELGATDHPLFQEQNLGITLDRLFEIYALNGHEI